MWNCLPNTAGDGLPPIGLEMRTVVTYGSLWAVDAGNICRTYQAQGKVRKFVKKLTSSAELTESEHSVQRRLPPLASRHSVPESKQLSLACAGRAGFTLLGMAV
jgi:hypothetical protein